MITEEYLLLQTNRYIKFILQPDPRYQGFTKFILQADPRYQGFTKFILQPDPRYQGFTKFILQPDPGYQGLLSVLIIPAFHIQRQIPYLGNPVLFSVIGRI